MPSRVVPIGDDARLFNTETMAEGVDIDLVPIGEGAGDIDEGGIDETGFGGNILPSTTIIGLQPGDSIDKLRNALKEGVVQDAVDVWLDAVRFAAAKSDKFDFQEILPIDYDNFKVEKNRALYLRKPNGDGYVRLTVKNKPIEFRSVNSVATDIGDVKDVREALESLGFIFRSLKALPNEKQMRKALQEVKKESEKASQAGSSKDFSKGVDKVVESLNNSLRVASIHTEVIPFRELKGLDQRLRSIAGNLATQESKRLDQLSLISEIESKLEVLIKDAQTSEEDLGPEIDKERQNLTKARDELAGIKESISILQGQARSQVQAVKDLVGRLLREDTSLAEKLRTIFREQGITIAAIITALGAIIAALVEGLTGGGGSSGSSGSGDGDKKSPRSAAKRAFDAMASGLKWLASKAAAALPGIIGAVVSFLLKGAAAVASWLGANLWAVLMAVGAVAYGVVQRALRDRQERGIKKEKSR